MKKFVKLWHLLNLQLKIKFFILVLIGIINSFLEIFSLSLLFTILASMIGNPLNFENIYIFNKVFSFFDEYNYNLFLIFLIAYTFKFFFATLNIYFQNKTVFSFLNILITRLFKKYLYTNISKIKKKNSSEILRNLNEEISQVALGFMNSICTFLIELIMLTSLIFLIFKTQSMESVIVLFVVICVAFLISNFIKKAVFKLAHIRQKFNFLKYNHIKESFIGIKDVKIFSAEISVIENLKKIVLKLSNTNIFINFGTALPRHLIEFIIVIAIILIIFLLEYKGLSPEKIFSSLAFLSIILVKSLPVLNRLINSSISFSSFAPSLNIVCNELLEYGDVSLTKSSLKKLNFTNLIQLKDISFKYDEKQIFKKKSFNIKKGKITGIVGKSGSGKSTLIEIIMGLIKPDSGEIFIDDIKLDGNEALWLKHIGYVPQNVYLNSEKIKNNIAFGIKEQNIDFNKVVDSANNSLISNFIDSLPGKYNQNLGENAQLVSGGQKQRIGIARALYKDCEVLIFDEATNSLDKNTEKAFLNFISSLKGSKTIIIVSHNESISTFCDEIININNR